MTLLKEKLIEIATARISSADPSHDIGHALRVLQNAEAIAQIENADLEVLIPAALFHDLVTYSRNDPRSKLHPQESAVETVKILESIPDFPREKISAVEYAIRMHDSKDPLNSIEAKIVQDADNLEITGAIIVMRMFASAGNMGRAFYHPDDPWGERRELDGLKWTLDYYTGRLLKVENEMHTEGSFSKFTALKTASHFIQISFYS